MRRQATHTYLFDFNHYKNIKANIKTQNKQQQTLLLEDQYEYQEVGYTAEDFPTYEDEPNDDAYCNLEDISESFTLLEASPIKENLENPLFLKNKKASFTTEVNSNFSKKKMSGTPKSSIFSKKKEKNETVPKITRYPNSTGTEEDKEAKKPSPSIKARKKRTLDETLFEDPADSSTLLEANCSPEVNLIFSKKKESGTPKSPISSKKKEKTENVPKISRYPTSTGPEEDKEEEKPSLSVTLRKKLTHDEDGKCTNALQILATPEVLKIAYETIKSKPGNMVEGSDKETLDGISEKWFQQASLTILDESYQPKPARRVYIPKKNGKMRPLGISSPRDKIVQQSARIIMEEILEPKFMDSSHGFRPNRGCHIGLQKIREWKGVPWILEGDIKAFFDSIDHHLLASLIEKHFKEARLLHLYWKMVKAGYVEWDNNKMNFVASDVGVPQGGIISPLLSNLVLHELDLYMEKRMAERDLANKGIKAYQTNPAYHRITMQIHRLEKKKQRLLDRGIRFPQEDKIRRKKLLSERRKMKSLIPNPAYLRYTYERYADDWQSGIWGSRKAVVALVTISKYSCGPFIWSSLSKKR